MDALLAWLLADGSPPWVRYRARRDLSCQGDDDPQVQVDRRALLADPQVQGLLAELAGWPGKVISSHKSAGQPFHKLTFAADLGLRADDPGVGDIIEHILAHPSAQGPFSLPMTIAPAYGGSGQEQWGWALCDAPLTLYALLKFGLGEDPRVQAAVAHLTGLVRENGWPCAVSPELGSWRGPGRKEDPCPFANLAMLKALAPAPAWRDSPAARAGAETLLALWAESRGRHPYIFYMGTDFRKLKYPMFWYDILHVAEVLSRFEAWRNDSRLTQMAEVIASQADKDGRFTPQSVWTAWKEWDFGQKKEPSRLLTLAARKVLSRYDAIKI
jgi:hypothetical protein